MRTSKLGDVSGFSDAKAPSTMAIEAPEPTIAARNEAISINLRRIQPRIPYASEAGGEGHKQEQEEGAGAGEEAG